METKTYVFDGNNGSSNNQQFDPNLLWAMMFGGGGFGGYGGGNWIWPLFLLALWGGNGFGGFGGGNGLIGGTALQATYYWSSTQHDTSQVWRLYGSSGALSTSSKRYDYRVRAFSAL